jgi:hypothetical protein
MATVLCGAGLVLALVLLVAIDRKVGALPSRVRALAREERARDDNLVVSALHEATAAKVGKATAAIRDHEEQIAAAYRALVAELEVRARAAERSAGEAQTALSAASALVRELRALIDDARAHRPSRPAEAGDNPAASMQEGDASEQRKTVRDASHAPPAGDDDDEEMTTVAGRPAGVGT